MFVLICSFIYCFMEINLNLKFKEVLDGIDVNNKPNLFLHVCCAPCSSAVLEKICNYFNIYIIYHNPNIDTFDEFNHRLSELKKLVNLNGYNVKIIYMDYIHDEFLSHIIGYENEPEGGKRCYLCYELRLKRSYEIALDYINKQSLNNMKNYLCSTLSISPHKDAKLLYEIGINICEKSNGIITYLPNDFKKEDGYLKSIELSKKFDLYRQNYCGCEFAKTT